MSQPASPLVNHLPSAGLVRNSSRRDFHAVRYRSCWPLVRLLTARLLTACFLTALLPLQAVDAQSSIAPRFTSSNDVPGTVAFASLLANPQWVGRVQPVKLQLPENTVVGTWQGSWVDTEYANPTVATSVGPIYQVRIRGEFRTQSFDLYPSLEIVSCLNPPADLQLRFPVPIAISEEDIETALTGKLVTKIIYVENPETALPYRQLCNGHQAYFDVTDLEDPIRTASRLGRPIAILRLGTRQPSDAEMSYGNGAAIPLTVFPPQAARELDRRALLVSFQKPAGQERATASAAGQGPEFRFSNPTQNPLPGGVPSGNPSGNEELAGRQPLSIAPAAQPLPQAAWGSDPCNLCPAPLGVAGGPGSEPFHRDEFLFDGGDKNFHVTVDQNWNLNGLDVEDTVAAFDTLGGTRQVVASNRVAIYAPRFAAVRKISGYSLESLPTRLARFNDTVELEATRGKDISSTTLQQLQPQQHATQLRARGFNDQTRGLTADNVTQPRRAEDRTRSSSHLQHTRYRGFANSEGARLELAAVAARSWEDNLGLQVVADRRQAVITRDAAKVHELVTVKSDNGEAQLKILKQASAISAACGEEVEFTISFENVGARKIGNVTIIDNLTTRLEYVPDSAQCSLDADFSSERNAADSLVLRWDVKQTLDVGQSGLIRFKCRVR
ncbi:MAG: hypothetical protein ACK493_05735 [Planctomycetota bacterium]